MTLRKTIDETLRVFLAGYVDASNSKDASKLSTTLTPDCIRTFSPASFLTAIGAPTDAALDNKAYEDFFTSELPFAKSTSVDEISHVVIDTEGKTAAARSVYTNVFSDGVEIKFEFGWFLNFSEDGTKITKVLEFMDSIGAQKYQAKISELRGST